METKDWIILSQEEQMSIIAGRWVIIDGKVYWINEADKEHVENTF